jgi:protein-S-isoprenylcysteine O-methyltransferase Ste14
MTEPTPRAGKPGKADGFTARGGIWVLVQFGWMIAIGVAGGWFHGEQREVWAVWLGTTLVWVGGWVGTLGAVHLGKNRTAYPKPRGDGELVVTGVYGWMRHPLYTSLILLAAGWSMGRWNWLAGVLTVGFACFLDAKARREETWLERVYPDYGEYRRRVSRFIPGIY